ncbi:MAG: hypothetical protein V1827_02400 [Candidatus Micrarchaeota archaeon]
MRLIAASAFLLMLACAIHAQLGTQGGNITQANASGNTTTNFWVGVVGQLNESPNDPGSYASTQDTPTVNYIYTNDPNGSYNTSVNTTMILTRLPYKPNESQISAPVPSDFNQTGIFSNFTIFSGIPYDLVNEDPYDTFVGNWATTTCYIFSTPFTCPYIILEPDIQMAVLKFYNGTHYEPLFIGTILNQTGFNGSAFDFEYMLPALETYYFYLYSEKECNITVWIDGVQTTTLPNTGVPYGVEVLVASGATPISNLRVDAVEENGRDSFLPILELGRRFLTMGFASTNSSGRTAFVLSPTRYNIPDSYGHTIYIEVNGYDGYSCRKNLTIGNYGSLSPTYRTSLINSTYASQVKASSQNQNSLASTASKWIEQGKMKVIDVTVYTNGTYLALPTLQAGAPNMLNITAINHTSLAVINATANVLEADGQIIFIPMQPGKDGYDNSRGFFTNQTPMLIPTRYNNNANISVMVGIDDSPFAYLNFTVDSTLAPPTGADADMDSTTRSAVSSAQQNINSVLVNIAKSLSTV